MRVGQLFHKKGLYFGANFRRLRKGPLPLHWETDGGEREIETEIDKKNTRPTERSKERERERESRRSLSLNQPEVSQ